MFNLSFLEEQYNYDLKNSITEETFEKPLINVEDVIKAHYFIADYFLDESSEKVEKMSYGVKSQHLLGSAVGRQICGYAGRKKYDNPIEICSTIFYGLVTDHPFVDGNKRTALLVLLYQLQLYGYFPKDEIKKFEELVVSVAGRSLSTKHRSTYKKFHEDNIVDNEVLTIAYELRRLTEKTNRSYHLNFCMKDFCDNMKAIGVHYELENSKI